MLLGLLAFAATDGYSAEPQVQLTDLKGQVHSGELTELNEGALRLGSKPGTSWKRSDVLRLDWPRRPSGLLEDSPQLLLANGDRLGILPVEINEESLSGTWHQFPAWSEIQVPLETLRGGILLSPRGLLERARSLARLRDQQEKQDLFYLVNGDRLPGQLESLQKNAFQLQTNVGMSTLAVETVKSFGMNPELTSFPAAKTPQSLLFLEDGSQITINDFKLVNDSELQCQAAFGADLVVPIEQIVSLQFLGGAIEFLSDLEPVEFISTPYLNRKWPLRKNQNAIGGPLRLAGREYARGLGMHSQAVCDYDLKGEYISFQATVGIDAAADGRGSVIFRVLTDGKTVFTSEILRGKSAPISIGPLSLDGVKRLTLAVDFADEGDILDHANWCDALMIKATK